MTDINTVVLVGNLVRDLGSDERSFGFTNSGMARANISIAVNRSVKRNNEWTDETSYFDVVIWGKTAENLKPYLTKGQKVAIQGSLKQERWTKDGQNFSRVVINAETVELCGGRKEGGSQNYQQSAPVQQNRPAPVQAPMQNSFSNDDSFGGDSGFPENISF